MKTFLLVVFTFLFLNGFTQTGSLDKSFGKNGLSTVGNSGYPQTTTLLVLKDDKMLVFNTNVEDGRIHRLTRFLPDGQIDNSFGKDGSQEVSNLISEYSSLLVQQDNKIVIVTGTFVESATAYVIALFRYLPDGTPDSSFGINGIYVDSSLLSVGAFDATIQPDGKILACGQYVVDANEGDIFPLVARYNQDGTPDKGFGINGKSIVYELQFVPYSIVLQKDGKIVCAGDNSGRSLGIVARYTISGKLDSSFGTNGTVKSSFTKKDDFYTDVAIQEDDKIVAVGTAQFNAFNNIDFPLLAVARYNPDGDLDETFDQDGKIMIPFERSTLGKSVTLQPDGKIVVSGSTGDDDFDYCIGRLNTDGSLDAEFGTDGKTITDINEGSYDDVFQVGLQSTGNIIVSGVSGTSNLYNGLLARYKGNSIKQPSPIVKKIKRWLRNHTLNWQFNDNDVDYFVIEQSSNSVNGFKEVAKVKANEQRTMNNEQYVYTYNLNTIANSQQLKANSQTYYRITAINNNNKVVSDVISDEDVISITVSPNPVKDVLKISGLPVNQKATISIVDRNGNVLQTAVSNSSTFNMNVSGLHSSLYTVQLKVNGRLRSVKFVKE